MLVASAAAWQECHRPPATARPLNRKCNVRRLPVALSSAGSSSSGGDEPGFPEMVRRRGKMVPVDPGLAAQLESLARQCGIKDVDMVAGAVTSLDGPRRQSVIDNGLAVEAHLRSLGIEQQQMAELLLHCPLLFSRPFESRASVLFGQMMGQLGMTAAEAATCFRRREVAFHVTTFEPAIRVMAALLAAGSPTGKPGKQLLGEVLTRQPSAVELLVYHAERLQSTIDYLLELGLTHKQLAAVLPNHGYGLLGKTRDHLAALEAVLEQELSGDRQLWLKVILGAPRTCNIKADTLRDRLQALAAGFGMDLAREMVHAAPALLGVGPSVWQRNVAVMQLLGLADLHAYARNLAQVLHYNWLSPGLLVNMLALQRCMPGRPTAAQVICSWASCVAGRAADRFAARLLFLEQLELVPVADKRAAKQDWRLQHGMPASKPALGEPAFISVGDVSRATPADFAALVAAAATQKDRAAVSSGNIAADFKAFQAGLKELPSWQELWADAEAWSQELAGQLPP